MTIINLVQHHHHNAGTVNSNAAAASGQAYQSLQLLGYWVNQLSWINQQAAGEVKRLQSFQADHGNQEQHHHLRNLAILQQSTTSCLQRISQLLEEVSDKKPSRSSPRQPVDGREWTWLSFQYFFEGFNPEMARFQLWALVRPLLSGQLEATGEEREAAASFYELGNLLIDAAWALYQGHGKQGSSS